MSPEPAESPQEWELRVQVPPGWVEFVAYEDDASALAAFDELLAPLSRALSADQVVRLRQNFARARCLSTGANLRIGGTVLTLWDENQPTAWYYGIWAWGMAGLDGISPVGLLERGLGWAVGSELSALSAMLDHSEQEDFTLVDGRVGSSLHATLRADLVEVPTQADGIDPPGQMGIVLAAVPLPGLPDAAALILGVSPTVEQRPAMSVYASVMAHSVHVVGETMPHVLTVDIALEDAFDDRSAGVER